MYQSTDLIAYLFIVAKMHIKKAPLREQWSLDGSFAVLLDGLVPWQDVIEVLWMPLDVGVRQVLKEVLEVLEWIQAVGLGSLDDAVDGGAGLGSFRRVAEQPILAADGEVANGALADVVRERGVATLQEGLERFFMAQGVLDGLAELGFWQDLRLDVLKPCEISLELLFFKLETLFFALFFRESCQSFVDGKELVDPLDGFFADAADEIFFRQIWRNGLDEVPPCMCPAEGMCVAGYFLVAGVAVCLQDAVESLEEIFGVTATAARLVLVEADGMRLLVLAAAENPHVGFRRILAALLFVDPHGRLICMDDILLEESLLQSRGKRHEPVLGGPDDPVGQRCTREREANLFPFSFLSVKWHGLLVLLHHDMRDARRRCDGLGDNGLRHGRLLDGEMRFLAAGEALEGFAVVVDDLDLGGDELNLCADLLFAHRRQGCAAAFADALFFWQRDEAFLMRELRQKLGCMVLLLLAALMRGHLDVRL